MKTEPTKAAYLKAGSQKINPPDFIGVYTRYLLDERVAVLRVSNG
ncbi:hypothetical protein [Limnofasciculus baicalensis]|nr:hypothetical protein [Limnofasciculus baicalensis]